MTEFRFVLNLDNNENLFNLFNLHPKISALYMQPMLGRVWKLFLYVSSAFKFPVVFTCGGCSGNRSQVFSKRDVLKNFLKFTQKNLFKRLFSIKFSFLKKAIHNTNFSCKKFEICFSSKSRSRNFQENVYEIVIYMKKQKISSKNSSFKKHRKFYLF